ncbi:MAG: 16S rRNA (guanine(527)-N(7))-methyltransferase RsmG [Paludibacteraceae bacterium]|nr:16S rRNA (guanine(527)-N(7))-methyltransferase RsmG [Paludibacteraceae bacterium]
MLQIQHYFPQLTETQLQQLRALGTLYTEWNAKINVISRKDIGNLYEHHVLHSLSIARFIHFRPGTEVLDVGTGGGFPGVPLAIMFPEVRFKLIDSIGKKIKVAAAVAESVGLKNVQLEQLRAEDEHGRYDFVVSRAAMSMSDLVKLVRKNISKHQQNAMPNGIICLKGGDLQAELKPFGRSVELTGLSTWFSEEFFQTKQLIYLPV